MWSLGLLVAAVHYMYMRVYWVQAHKSSFVYKHVEGGLAVPLQMIVFNLILKALKTSPHVVPRDSGRCCALHVHARALGAGAPVHLRVQVR